VVGLFAVGDARSPVVASGLAGLLGGALVASALVLLQIVRPDVDWRHDYVSDLANGHLGWLFIAATFAHGAGNLATGAGLHLSLERSPHRDWVVFIFCVSSVGVMLGAVITDDAPGAAPSVAGHLHSSIASLAFASQLLAVSLFSVEFARQPYWRGLGRWSAVVAMLAVAAMFGYFAAVHSHRMRGLTERLSLGMMLVWALRVARQLSRWGAIPHQTLASARGGQASHVR
jgi:hypothetical protein